MVKINLFYVNSCRACAKPRDWIRLRFFYRFWQNEHVVMYITYAMAKDNLSHWTVFCDITIGKMAILIPSNWKKNTVHRIRSKISCYTWLLIATMLLQVSNSYNNFTPHAIISENLVHIANFDIIFWNIFCIFRKSALPRSLWKRVSANFMHLRKK